MVKTEIRYYCNGYVFTTEELCTKYAESKATIKPGKDWSCTTRTVYIPEPSNLMGISFLYPEEMYSSMEDAQKWETRNKRLQYLKKMIDTRSISTIETGDDCGHTTPYVEEGLSYVEIVNNIDEIIRILAETKEQH